MKTEFTEKQRIGNWIFILPAMDMLLTGAIILDSYYDNKTSLNELIIVFSIIIAINIAIVFLILNMVQYTIVNEKGLHYRYPPFCNKWQTIPLEVITAYEITEHSGLNYGYGIGKWNFFAKYDQLTTMGLDKVIKIQYKAKKPLHIGTQKATEFYNTLKKLKNNNDYV